MAPMDLRHQARPLGTNRMNLAELARRIGAAFLTPGPPRGIEVRRIYAGDRMSDLLSHVAEHTLLVTHLSNHSLARLIDLMDTPAVCLVSGATPDQTVLDAAHAAGTALLLSPSGMAETCESLHQALNPPAGLS